MTKRVWIVEDEQGDRVMNWGTGTRVYTRKANAMSLAKKNNWRPVKRFVVEYELVEVNREEVNKK